MFLKQDVPVTYKQIDMPNFSVVLQRYTRPTCLMPTC